jgi:hypothetical protein
VYDEEDEEETAKEGGEGGGHLERFSRVSSEPLPTREIAIPSDKFRPSPSIQVHNPGVNKIHLRIDEVKNKKRINKISLL